VREGQGFEVSGDARAPFGRVDGSEQFREGTHRRIAAEGCDLPTFEQLIDGAADARPEFDLAGDRALHDVGGEAGIEDQAIGELDGLAHGNRVA